jgi:methylmalonyl-CoA mutase
VFGGGGGTITPEEIRELQAYGVERIYHPNDGMHMGLVGDDRGRDPRASAARLPVEKPHHADFSDEIAIGRMLSAIEDGALEEAELAHLRKQWQLAGGKTPVVGITGTGGAGKSSVTDELLNRFLACFPDMRIAVISVDPTRRRTGGALLGDRIRMNSLRSERVFMRSMATRRQHMATNAVLKDCIAFLKSLGYDLVIVETAGIGQSDSEIVDLVDFPMYVMTSDYGAASQLEKIDMLDYAELVVLNKFDKRGAEDACATCASSGSATASRSDEGRGRPGLSHHRQPVQRPRHQLDVRQPVPPAAQKLALGRRANGRRRSTPR